MNGIHEVTGSTPVWSTNLSNTSGIPHHNGARCSPQRNSGSNPIEERIGRRRVDSFAARDAGPLTRHDLSG